MQFDITQEVAAMRQMTIGQLAERYAEVFGEQTRSRHKEHLVRKIAWRLQAMVEGDLSARARRRASELANDADVRVMPPKNDPVPAPTGASIKVEVPIQTDSRIPAPGTALARKYKGRNIQVVVLADGFEYAGQRFKSLSAVAKAITGTHCNGFRFFNLEARKDD